MDFHDGGLENKIVEAKNILRKQNDKPANSAAILFTGSKETTVILDLVRDMYDGRVPYPVVHIDTGLETEELYEYRDKIQKEWNFSIEVVKRHGTLSPDDITGHEEECCKKFKVESLRESIGEHGWKALIFDPRDSGFEGISGFISVVNPVAHFEELDFWKYIRQKSLPFCSLYRKGFRFISCEPCLRPWLRRNEPSEENKEEIINRLKTLGYF
ncbi:MAG: phosphoadenosine phosphosulfate reductase family protein [Nitrospirota bacterium]